MTPEQIQLTRELLPILGAVAGAAVGVAGGAISTMILTRAETRRQRQRLAFEIGMKEWEIAMDSARASGVPTDVYPPVTFIHLYAELLQRADKGLLTADSVRQALQRNDEVNAAVDEYNEENKKKGQKE
jgi:hypothetical protein